MNDSLQGDETEAPSASGENERNADSLAGNNIAADQQQLTYMQMLLYGYAQWQEAQGQETNIDISAIPAEAQQLAAAQDAPVTGEDLMSTWKYALSYVDDLNVDDVDSNQLQEISENLTKAGLEGFLDDGILDKEEVIIASAEMGKAYEASTDGISEPSEALLETAGQVLAEHGIDDLDGSLARGLAVNIDRITNRVNEGLGLSRDEAAPAMEKGFTVTETAPTGISPG